MKDSDIQKKLRKLHCHSDIPKHNKRLFQNEYAGARLFGSQESAHFI